MFFHWFLFFPTVEQWIKTEGPQGKTYNDITFPISFAKEVYQIIPVDWDSTNTTSTMNKIFTIATATIKLTGARITASTSTGAYAVLIIGM